MKLQSMMGFSSKILFCAIVTVATLTKWKAVSAFEVTRIGVWEQESEEKGILEGRVKWLEHDDDTIPLALGAIDESNALYSGWLRKEGIL